MVIALTLASSPVGLPHQPLAFRGIKVAHSDLTTREQSTHNYGKLSSINQIKLNYSGAPTQASCAAGLDGRSSRATVSLNTAVVPETQIPPISDPMVGRMFAFLLAFPGTLGLAMFASFAGERERRALLLSKLLYGLAFLCLVSIGVTMPALSTLRNRGGDEATAATYNLEVPEGSPPAQTR